ncbi:hypothetical protein GCM10011506_06170 [Marivirga lumbricoides]|uniref:Uncharacterized protein n=1 Tax=Marivirga lumbricoides TaxID=1046115 RepID=A0ABQ1LHF1_9BACT|nr:hypothetical protein GCM10011506_06170 [Marivirga lumbricoides]
MGLIRYSTYQDYQRAYNGACFLSTEDSPELVSMYENMISIQIFNNRPQVIKQLHKNQ